MAPLKNLAVSLYFCLILGLAVSSAQAVPGLVFQVSYGVCVQKLREAGDPLYLQTLSSDAIAMSVSSQLGQRSFAVAVRQPALNLMELALNGHGRTETETILQQGAQLLNQEPIPGKERAGARGLCFLA